MTELPLLTLHARFRLFPSVNESRSRRAICLSVIPFVSLPVFLPSFRFRIHFAEELIIKRSAVRLFILLRSFRVISVRKEANTICTREYQLLYYCE